MAELRDPKETGAHVNRVASYTAEIYGRWAETKGLDREEIRRAKDVLRVSAMLHDVGKVAVSDTILKKPGRLTPDEYHLMKFHTIAGAQLFGLPASELDRVSQEIALNHHERWDGGGYPGRIDDIFADEVQLGPGKEGEEIPIFARAAAVADVFDALISPRVYKDPWPEDKVLETIRSEAGAQFDPDVVESFLAVYPKIKAIRARYKE
jgi:response regulator RpfG family c-di-GMP phosphodiesterase